MTNLTEQKTKFTAALHAHMAKHGAKDWKLLLQQFPEVHEQTMWRWIRAGRKEVPPEANLSDARTKLAEAVRKFPTTTRAQRMAKEKLPEAEEIVDHLPAAPSPSYIAKAGDDGLRTLDFVAEIQSLYRDATMLRTYAVRDRVDPDTGEVREVINNPAAFDKSIARRADLLETAIRAVQEVWDLRTMQRFYETIIEEIGFESPDCQKRILERLAKLNARTGMTLGAMRL